MTSWIIDILVAVGQGAGILPRRRPPVVGSTIYTHTPPEEAVNRPSRARTSSPRHNWTLPAESRHYTARGYVPEWAEPLD